MAEYTDQERDTIRSAAFGAMALVSRAEPGFFDMFKESMAGSRALQSAPPTIRDLIAKGGFPTPPKGSNAQELEGAVMGSLAQAAMILKGKSQEDFQGFRDVVNAAADAVGEAKDGTSDSEKAVIDKIRTTLS